MDVEIYSAEDVIARRGKGGKRAGAKYADYAAAIKPHLEWLREQIEGSEDGMIRVKLADFAKACGKTMKKVVGGKVVDGSAGLDPTSLGWGFKYVLFHAGYFFTLGKVGKVGDEQPVMIIRKKNEGDMLPRSLAKYDEENTVTGGTGETGGEAGEGEAGETGSEAGGEEV